MAETKEFFCPRHAKQVPNISGICSPVCPVPPSRSPPIISPRGVELISKNVFQKKYLLWHLACLNCAFQFFENIFNFVIKFLEKNAFHHFQFLKVVAVDGTKSRQMGPVHDKRNKKKWLNNRKEKESGMKNRRKKINSKRAKRGNATHTHIHTECVMLVR